LENISQIQKKGAESTDLNPKTQLVASRFIKKDV
jgi:hypothetical protein